MKNFAGGEPADVDQMVPAIKLDHGENCGSCNPDDENPGGPVDRSPPVESSDSEHHGKAAERDGQEYVANQIQSADHFRPWRRGERQQVDKAKRDHRQPHFDQVEHMIAANVQEVGRNDPANRRRQRQRRQRHAYSNVHLSGGGHRLKYVKEGQRTQRCRGHSGKETQGQCALIAVHPKMP